MAIAQQSNDFMILGPAMAPGNKVLEAIHALYFLPENFKLNLTGSGNVDQSFYNEVLSLVERDGLGARVQFDERPQGSDVVIASSVMSGDSPEALASEILSASRTLAA